MNDFRIEITGTKADIYSPYNAQFVTRIRTAGGRWNANKRCWTIPADAVSIARDMMRDVYGRDDSEPLDTVTVRVTFRYQVISDYRSGFTYFGKEVSSARGRDSEARMGNDAMLVAGRITSGGSIKNWVTIIDNNTVIDIYRVPRNHVETFAAQLPDGAMYEIIENNTKSSIDVEALRAERERIAERLAQIDALLSTIQEER